MSDAFLVIEPGEIKDGGDRRFSCLGTLLTGWDKTSEVVEGDTAYVYAFDATVLVSTPTRRHALIPGEYGRFAGPARFTNTSIANKGGGHFIAIKRGHNGSTLRGGPIEASGRLRYIDGCTDSLLLSPDVYGDPCFNHLHFPKGIDQTMHIHPSARIGIVARGRGVAVTPEGEYPLVPGLAFVITPDGLHKFRTEDETMDVIAFHPDSDFGPNDDDHPMINRTIVDGVCAALIEDIRTVS